ncbi:hypothetical protein, partial [Listeria monocytogenes]|uniref:hypothetical protein n=1 Tax=Listeria monocytogenes TaxID=1639 RepID=UPI003FA48D33
QLAHRTIPGFGQPDGLAVHITYDEGAAIGYKWFDARGLTPRFAFGRGLSYTTFKLADLQPRLDGQVLKVAFTLANTGQRAGK